MVTCVAVIGLFTSVASAEPAPTVSVELGPTVSYRTFRDREPTSADKNYATSAIVGADLQVRVYPFAAAPVGAAGLGGLGGYAHGALGFLSSQDIDVPANDPAHNVATTFWRASAGLLYRLSTRVATAPLALTALAGVERWAFTFDMPSPPLQLTPTARYTLARLGAEAELKLGFLGLRAEAGLLLPWAIDDLGDRPVLTRGFGVQGGAAATVELAAHVALLASTHYALFSYELPQILPRSNETARVHDRYLDFLLGARLTW